MCHDAAMPSKNVRLDSPEAIATHAQQVYQQVVVLKLMPLNNATQITDAERAQIGRWFEAGAPSAEFAKREMLHRPRLGLRR